MRKFFMYPFCLLGLLGVFSCGTYPQFKSNVYYRYSQAPFEQASNKQTKESITIEDKGTAEKVIQPIKVQACEGNLLLVRIVEKVRYTKYGQIPYKVKEPVFETVDPLENVYLRRIKLHNATEHVLQLAQIDVVFVDPAGNEYEMISKELLEGFIRSNRPCPSTEAIVSALKPLKLLGGGRTKIRPKRDQDFFVAFPNLKINIPGEWRLEFHDFPTKTNEAGNIIRKTSFEFPFEVKKYKIIVEQRKDGFMDSWKEISRNEEETSN